MRKPPNKLWAFGPPLSLLLLACVYYIKVPAFRDFADNYCPWAKQYLGRFVQEPEVVMVKDPRKTPPLISNETSENGAQPSSAPPSKVKKRRAGAASSGPVVAAPPEPLTLERLAANPSLWPKTVKLRKSTEFPAFVNGKPVGTIQAPPGTEANLIKIQNETLGLEYQGGGKWVPASETDLLEKMKISSRCD